MSVSIGPGVVFWPRPTKEAPQPHPRFVISDIVSGKVLTVNITDKAKHPELCCVLEIKEHESVTKRSAVFFQLFREFDAVQLARVIAEGKDVRKGKDLDPQLLARIVAGFKSDKNVRDSIKVKYGFLPSNPALKKPF